MTKSYLVQAAALAHSRPYDQGLRHGAQRTLRGDRPCNNYGE
jgi:hypothetical protein